MLAQGMEGLIYLPLFVSHPVHLPVAADGERVLDGCDLVIADGLTGPPGC